MQIENGFGNQRPVLRHWNMQLNRCLGSWSWIVSKLSKVSHPWKKTLTPHSSSLNLASVCRLGMWHCYFSPFLIKCNYLEKKKVLRKHVISQSKNLLLRKLFLCVQIRSGGEVWGKCSVPNNLGTNTHVTELGCLVLACNYSYKK